MQRPLVSIAVAAYKTRPSHLSAAIKSALAQSWANVEIVVCDDSPNTLLRQIVDDCGDQRVTYRHNPTPLGVAGNHWRCFNESNGEYLVVLNHDDLLEASMVERLVMALEADRSLAVAFCDHWVIDVAGRRKVDETNRLSAHFRRATLRPGVHRPFFDLLAAQTIPMAMGAMFRRSALPSAAPTEIGPAYDLWLTYLLCVNSGGAFYVPERLSSWRAHDDNLTTQARLDWFVDTARCWEAITRDSRLSSIHPVARRHAAGAFSRCAVRAWRANERGSLRFGVQSLLMTPTWRGVVTCVLPVVPLWLGTFVRAAVQRGAEGAL